MALARFLTGAVNKGSVHTVAPRRNKGMDTAEAIGPGPALLARENKRVKLWGSEDTLPAVTT